MTQYLDEQGLHYIVDKLNEKVTQISENEFEILSTLSPDCIYAVTETDQRLIYFNLKAINDGDITITIPSDVNSTYATSISYSKDKSNWTDTVVDSTNQTITIPVVYGDKVYLKGIAKQWANNTAYTTINSTANIIASGNIMSLLYGDDFEDKTSFPSGSTYNLHGLFDSNTHLIAASQLKLPATTLTGYCYSGMFQDCSSLIFTPELPATALAVYCYNGMFQGCSSLTTAPKLPATTLRGYCYSNMFCDCISLTSAPELPATALAGRCYMSMFYGCLSLTSAPELPATTLADNCYYTMFSHCTSLTSAPELPATTLTPRCYLSMFYGCSSLTSAPELPATILVDSCYYTMFQGCSSLTSAPELPATTLVDSCYRGIFYNCTSLNNITMLAEDISASNCLTNWVRDVASSGTFTKAASMTSLPTGVNGIPNGWTVVDYTA